MRAELIFFWGGEGRYSDLEPPFHFHLQLKNSIVLHFMAISIQYTVKAPQTTQRLCLPLIVWITLLVHTVQNSATFCWQSADTWVLTARLLFLTCLASSSSSSLKTASTYVQYIAYMLETVVVLWLWFQVWIWQLSLVNWEQRRVFW